MIRSNTHFVLNPNSFVLKGLFLPGIHLLPSTCMPTVTLHCVCRWEESLICEQIDKISDCANAKFCRFSNDHHLIQEPSAVLLICSISILLHTWQLPSCSQLRNGGHQNRGMKLPIVNCHINTRSEEFLTSIHVTERL